VIVVKLGGSIAKGGGLPAWLTALESGRGRVVIVPGGGAFADAVREAQRRHGFGDLAAHRMALLAMEQYAIMLADSARWLVPCSSAEHIAAALHDGNAGIWLPSAMALADPRIPQSWSVTGDSLAAWLARRLAASALVLVKSVAAPRPLDAAALAAQGLVDEAFPGFLAGSDIELDWAGPGEEPRLARRLAG
jgi:dihydroneopterin aldolase